MKKGSVPFVIVVLTTICAGALPARGAAVRDLKCEYRTDPLGVDVTKPRLSWKLDSTGRGTVQTAYQVIVASTQDALRRDEGDLWDSGKVESDQSVHVVYAGKPLKSRQRCYWKVRIWDNHGKASAWSKPAFWSMGLLEPSDWKGKWIGFDGGENEDHFKAANWIWCPGDAGKVGYFRRTFEIPSDREISLARVTIATHGLFSIYVNGKLVTKNCRVITSPAYEFDIENHLRPGENTIAIAASQSDQQDKPSGIICAFSADFQSGQPLVVASDMSWRATATDYECWERSDFDDSAWASASLLAPHPDRPRGDDFRRLPARMLRREVTIDRKIERATVYMCGLGVSELYINGSKVGDRVLSPGLTDYDKRCLYVTYDVTSNLKSGANALGVVLGNGRYFAPRYQAAFPPKNYGYPKLLLRMDVEYQDGTSKSIVSDESWKLTADGPILANNEYDGEIYDARREMPGWSEPGFDESKWQPAKPVDAPKGVLSSEIAEPIRVMDTVKPIAISNPRPGVYIFDMGQNMVGWCRLKVKGPRGTRVCLRFAELLAAEDDPQTISVEPLKADDKRELYFANLRSCKVTDHYILRGGGVEVWEPRFVYHGFRYVEVTGYPGKPDLSALEGIVVHDSVARAGEFSCSNDVINRIYRNMYWGIRGNYRSVPMDCPQRDERHGWFGDRAQVSKGEMYIFDTAAMQTKFIRDMEDSQLADGALPDLAPAYWDFYSRSVTFPTAFLVIPGHLHTQYGDTRILESHYDAMKRWAEMMLQRFTDGLLPEDTYGDWCAAPQKRDLIHTMDPSHITDKQLVSNAYFYADLLMLARFASLIGRNDDISRWHDLAARLKAAYNAKFLKPSEGIYDNGTQSSAVLSLAFGLVPEEHKARVFANLVDNITNKTDYHTGTGMIGGQWLMRTLSDNGRPDIAYRLATQTTYPSWGYMLANGATTIWELWNGDHGHPLMNSHNHVMQIGDLLTWLHEYVAGIAPDPAKPGFKHIIMNPCVVGDLTSARATHESPYGTITSDWKLDKGVFTWHIEIPVNTTATIYIPTSDAKTIAESGRPAASAEGVRFLRMEGESAVFGAGSGVYSFSSKLKP